MNTNILGIDIGSKHCLVSHTFSDTFPTIVNNKLSSPITPSSIIFNPNGDEVFIGDEAKDKQLRYPRFSSKNISLQNSYDPSIPYFYHTLLIETLVKDTIKYVNDKQKTMEKKDTTVVLTVPMQMNDEERELYREIIKEQFKFKNVLVESDLSSAAFCLHKMHNCDGKTVLIVDVGAHHTSAGLFRFNENVQCLKKESILVGGNTFDNEIVNNHVKNILKEKHKIDIDDDENVKTKIRAERAVEKARILLSTIPESSIEIDAVNDSSVMIKLSRDMLKTFIQNQLNQIDELVRKVLDGNTNKIDQVEIIGGTGRSPIVVQVVKDIVGEDVKFLNSIDSACAIAMGGCLYGKAFVESEMEKQQQELLEQLKKASEMQKANEEKKEEVKEGDEKKMEEEKVEEIKEEAKEKKEENNENNEKQQKLKEINELIKTQLNYAIEVIKQREEKMWIMNEVESLMNEYRRHIETNESKMNANEKEELSKLINTIEEWSYDMDEKELNELKNEFNQYKETIKTTAPTLQQYKEQKLEEQRIAKEKAEKERAEHISTGETAKKRKYKTNKEKIEAAEKAKDKGTMAFKETDWIGALNMYTKALGCLEEMFDMTPDDTEKSKTMKLALYLNLALTYIKVNKFNKALDNAQNALDIDDKNVKGLFRKGIALYNLKKYKEALECFTKSEELEHSNATVQYIKNIESKLQAEKEKERKMAQKMFGF